MRYQIFFPIACLQALNLFWYYLILRIAVRWVYIFLWKLTGAYRQLYCRALTAGVDDVRSEDEDDGDDDDPKED
jgi:very-long-chain ceramide synthase